MGHRWLAWGVVLALGLGLGGAAGAQALDEAVAAYRRGDYRTALAGFRQLAEQGDAAAQHNLGALYAAGQGVVRDELQAAQWFRKAAEQGHAQAEYQLARLYAAGRGVPQDEQQSAQWMRRAAEHGEPRAQFSLGLLLATGRGVAQDEAQAVSWYRRAAEQGHAGAQNNLGVMLAGGKGVAKDTDEAVQWYRKSAAQGHVDGMNNLGVTYATGQGVAKDPQQAYVWWLLASAKGHAGAQASRDRIERLLTAEQRQAAQAEASAKAREAQPPGAAPSGAASAPGQPASGAAKAPTRSSASGFRVAAGRIVTNHHVVNGCTRLQVNGVEAELQASDARSDLALLQSSLPGASASLRETPGAIGEPVAVVGYPLRGVLSGYSMTLGNLSSLAGVRGDTRLLQLSAPVQPGNSGGPMLDAAGNLLGVVVSKLNALKMARLTGDIPQNVNFAINTQVLRGFLDANGVSYTVAGNAPALVPTEIAEKARGFTVLVECWK